MNVVEVYTPAYFHILNCEMNYEADPVESSVLGVLTHEMFYRKVFWVCRNLF
jgi:hypothetical protein